MISFRTLAVTILSTLVVTSPAAASSADTNLGFFDGNTYGTQLTIGDLYQNHNRNLTVLDALIPLVQAPASVLFLDARLADRNGPSVEGSIGLAYRELSDEQQLWGIYGFYDRKRSSAANIFSQATLGGEYKTTSWLSDINIYLPFGKTSRIDHEYDGTQLISGKNPDGFNNIIFRDGKEHAMEGSDAELGYQFSQAPGLTAYLGAYYFRAQQVPSIIGPRARLKYDIQGLLGLPTRVFDHVTLETMLEHDNPRGTQWAAGAKFTLRFGGKSGKQLAPLQQHMLDPIHRDYDIVTGGNTKIARRLALNADGTPTTVGIATDANSLNYALSHNANVIAVRGQINGLTTLNLQDGQTLTGHDYVFAHGISLRVSNGGELNSEGSNTNLLLIGQNNTIHDLSLVTDAGRQSISNISTNSNGSKSVGHLTIDNVTSKNGNFSFAVNDGSTNNDVHIINNTIRMLNPSDGENGLEFNAGTASTIHATVTGNRIALGSGNNINGVYNVTNTNATIAYDGGFRHNFISIDTATADNITGANGVANVTNSSNSTISFNGGFSDNTININSASSTGLSGSSGVNNLLASSLSIISFDGGFTNNRISIGSTSSTGFSGSAGVNNVTGAPGIISFNGGFLNNKIIINDVASNNYSGSAGVNNIIGSNETTISFDGGFANNNITIGHVMNDKIGGAGVYNNLQALNSKISFNGGFDHNIITLGSMTNTGIGGAGVYNFNYDAFSEISFNGFYGNQVTHDSRNTSGYAGDYVFDTGSGEGQGKITIQIKPHAHVITDSATLAAANGHNTVFSIGNGTTFYK